MTVRRLKASGERIQFDSGSLVGRDSYRTRRPDHGLPNDRSGPSHTFIASGGTDVITAMTQQHPGSWVRIGVEALITREHALLLGLRRGGAGAGKWGLPGGHLENGETLEAGLCRELAEELGIQVRPVDVRLVAVVAAPDEPGGHYIHFGYVVEAFEGQFEAREGNKCAEWRFFSLEDLPINLFAQHRRQVECFTTGIIYAPARGD